MKRGQKRTLEYSYDIPLTMELVKENNHSLAEIVAMHEAVDGVYQCKICSKSFSETGFEEHLRRHMTDPGAECNICSTFFALESEYSDHMLKHVGMYKNSKLPEEIPLLRIRRAPAFVCGTCGQKFKLKFRLVRHLESEECSNKVEPEEDDKSSLGITTTSDNAADQSSNASVDNKKKFSCRVCQVSFQTYYKFSLHNKNFKKHHKLHGLVEIPRKRRKVTYRKRRNSDDTEDFSDIGDIALTEESIKENNFTTRQVFYSHKADENKGYTCKVCNRHLSNKQSFLQHLRKYTGEFMANCKLCGKGFTRLQNMQDHMKRHEQLGGSSILQGNSVDGNLKCETCRRSFKRSLCYIRHLERGICLPEIKKERLTLECHLCGLTFRKQFYLQIHMIKKHKNEGNDDEVEEKHDVNFILTKEIIKENKYNYKQVFRMHKPPVNGIFTCRVCLKSISQNNFLSHLRRHTEDWVAYCKVCEVGFNWKFSYDQHMSRHENSPDTKLTRVRSGRKKSNPEDHVQCDKCGQKFTRKAYLIRHYETKQCSLSPEDDEDEVNVANTSTSATTDSKYSLGNTRMKLAATKPKRVKCKICQIFFRTYYQLNLHNENFKEHHNSIKAIKVELNETNKKTGNHVVKRRTRLFSNVNFVDIGDIPLTNEIIKEKNYTLQQVFRSHNIIDGRYECKVCNKVLACRQTFIGHLRKHTGDYMAYCGFCKKGFTTVQSCKDHEIRSHGANGDVKDGNVNSEKKVDVANVFICDTCGYNFKSKLFLIRHKLNKKCKLAPKRKRHHKCDSCGARFLTFLQLAVHSQNQHSEDIDDDIELTMDIIRERNYTLLQVFRMHTPVDDSYQCKICTKYLTTKTFLDHLRMHTGDFVGFCKICQKGFTTKGNHALHMSRHMNSTLQPIGRPKGTSSQVFKCIRCDRRYKNKPLLIKHLRLKRCGKRTETHEDIDLILEENKTSRVFNKKKTFKCGICRMWFESRYKLKEHDDLYSDYHDMKEQEQAIDRQRMRKQRKNRNEDYCSKFRARQTCLGNEEIQDNSEGILHNREEMLDNSFSVKSETGETAVDQTIPETFTVKEEVIDPTPPSPPSPLPPLPSPPPSSPLPSSSPPALLSPFVPSSLSIIPLVAQASIELPEENIKYEPSDSTEEYDVDEMCGLNSSSEFSWENRQFNGIEPVPEDNLYTIGNQNTGNDVEIIPISENVIMVEDSADECDDDVILIDDIDRKDIIHLIDDEE